MLESLSFEYIAKEEVGELKDAVFLRNSSYIEAQRRLFQNIIHMKRRIKGSSTFKVTAQENGNQVEYTEENR